MAKSNDPGTSMGVTVRELLAALEAVPEEQRDLEVCVHLTPSIKPSEATSEEITNWLWLVEDGIPAVIEMFQQMPATIEDPQPHPDWFNIYCHEGISTASTLGTLKAFREWQEGDKE